MKKHKIWQLIVIDLLCIGVGLNLFALFHHVLPGKQKMEPVNLIEGHDIVPPSEEKTDIQPSDDPVPEEEETGSGQPLTWREKFEGKFTEGEVLSTDSTYMSENINITVSHVEENGVIYSVADIYLTDLQYLRSGFSKDEYHKGQEMITETASRVGAIVAVSGDHYGARQEGAVLRNGVLYRDSEYDDVCVIGLDGVMTTYTNEEFDIEAVKEKGAWQIWTFGPELLDDGNVKTKFNSSVTRANPRAAIGYVEPGHYYFVQVDGRIKESKGMTMEELSTLFHDLGCVSAYNLDGGQSAGFVWKGQLMSYPYNRPGWDIIYIGE